MTALHSYQEKAVEALIIASNCGGLVVSATGSGKTLLTGEYFRRLIGNGLMVVDTLDLLDQAKEEFENFLHEKIGIVGRSVFDPKRISVATIQTLVKHCDKKLFRDWFKSIDVLFIDEIHVAINRRNIDIVKQIRPKAVFGLTATLEMQKDYVRYPAIALAGPVIFEYPIQTGVEEGYLSRGVIVNTHFVDTLKNQSPGYWTTMVIDSKRVRVFIQPGTPFAEYRYHIALNKSRNDCIEELIREGLKRNHRLVVLVERKVHLRVLANRVKDLHHAALSGDNKTTERREAMKAMDGGSLPLILASRIFSRGVNIKTVDVIIDATALPGRNSAIQRYGRGTRKEEGKTGIRYINIYDHGSKFEWMAKQRLTALKEVGSPIVNFDWKSGLAAKLYQALECTLRTTKT